MVDETGLVERVARAIRDAEKTFVIQPQDSMNAAKARVFARAAIAAMPTLEALQQEVETAKAIGHAWRLQCEEAEDAIAAWAAELEAGTSPRAVAAAMKRSTALQNGASNGR